MKEYIRKELFNNLWQSLHGKLNLIQVVSGPRQVGKTTLALQIHKKWQGKKEYQTADMPDIPSSDWIIKNWHMARKLAVSKKNDVLLILDEVQKIPHWSEAVKRLFDEDKRLKTRIRVILLGSSALLMQKGLTESLGGRFEIHRCNHWSYNECNDYFSLNLDGYIFFGGYPGALPLRNNQERWGRYIRDSLIETVLSKDVLLMMPVTKPALLRQIFGLAVSSPAQVLSYQKMLGQLQDAGNTTTIASYIKLLSYAFLVAALERWSGSRIKQRGSIPKLIVLDNAIISAMQGRKFEEVKHDKAWWGRLIENAVGSKLYLLAQQKGVPLFYWRDRNDEIDYVLKTGNKLIAIEVKSTVSKDAKSGLISFSKRYKGAKLIMISPQKHTNNDNITHITIEDFFINPKKSLE